MTMSPGPTTIRKVSRLRAHLDFTTRPRTGTTSISKPAAGSITNLLLIALLLSTRAKTPRASRPAGDINAANRHKHLSEIVEGKEFELQELERRPSALRLHHRNFSGRSGGEDDSLRDYRFTAGTSTPYPPEYWEVDRRSVPYTFLETSSKLRREIKKPFPPSGRNGQLSRAIADGFPHWSKLQHRAP